MSDGAYLGYRDGDGDTPWGKYFNPEMAELPRHVVVALEHGPQADQTLLGFDSAGDILDDGYQQTENGYGQLRGGGFQVSVRTAMPGVTPAMWDWWFGWHGSETTRYKLWHPRAHASAKWADSGPDGHWVGRTSLIEEYLGSSYAKAAIQFVEPTGDRARSGSTRHATSRYVPGWDPRRCPSTSAGSSTMCGPPPTVPRCGRASGWADPISASGREICWPTR